MTEERNNPRTAVALDDETSIELADVFRTFGDSTRVRILWLLRSGEMCVEDISKGVGMSMSACSHQLKTLRQSDLVATRRDGKRILYKISDEHVDILLTVALEHMMEKSR